MRAADRVNIASRVTMSLLSLSTRDVSTAFSVVSWLFVHRMLLTWSSSLTWTYAWCASLSLASNSSMDSAASASSWSLVKIANYSAVIVLSFDFLSFLSSFSNLCDSAHGFWRLFSRSICEGLAPIQGKNTMVVQQRHESWRVYASALQSRLIYAHGLHP
jgi:hypothetical protein